MSFSINTNIAAQRSLNTLNNSSQGINSSVERFATGSKINRGADDASGMMLSDSLGSQARSAGQMISNATNDISRIQIADGALGEASNIMQGIREKVIQASSDALSSGDRSAIQNDIAKSLESLGQLYDGAEFNGQKLLSDRPGLSSLSQIDVSSLENTENSLKLVDDAMETTSSLRSDYGSRQNQISSDINQLGTQMINSHQSASTIRDVDFAEESMNMKTMEALRSAGMFALSQANTQPKNVMSLLGAMS
ncbi:MAG: flagellin [Desulfamplus sp.]|nr:flagellin [Desulfamplus sp.]